jgi:hypothetical protein
MNDIICNKLYFPEHETTNISSLTNSILSDNSDNINNNNDIKCNEVDYNFKENTNKETEPSSYSEYINIIQNNYQSSLSSKLTTLIQNKRIKKIKQSFTESEIQTLLHKSIFIFKENNILTNKIFIDYTVFKHYAHCDIFNSIVLHFVNLLQTIKINNSTIELHINLQSMTLSSLEKYKNIISLFITSYGNEYIQFINNIYIYYCPHFINAIQFVFSKIISSVAVNTLHEIKYYSIKETPEKLTQLFQNYTF